MPHEPTVNMTNTSIQSGVVLFVLPMIIAWQPDWYLPNNEIHSKIWRLRCCPVKYDFHASPFLQLPEVIHPSHFSRASCQFHNRTQRLMARYIFCVQSSEIFLAA